MTELVCMRLRNMSRTHPAQVTRHCGCGIPVGVYPSGQALLKRMPGLTIKCLECARAEATPDVVILPAARTAAEFFAERAQSRKVKGDET